MIIEDKGFVRKTICALLMVACSLPLLAQSSDSFIFSLPSIPDCLTTVPERATYLVEHYWDKAVFPETLSEADKDSIEQAWVDYCDLFKLTDEATIRHSLVQLLKEGRFKATTGIFLMALAEKYFYTPDSPFRNEKAYVCALKAFVIRPDIARIDQVRYAFQLRMLLHCKVGSKAADFSFTTADGTSTSLYRLSAPRILLFIYDPECDHCQLAMDWLETNSRIAELLSAGKLFILSVNVGDADHHLLKRFSPRDNWIDTRDTENNIADSTLYDLRTLPLMLLLDEEKKILVKTTEVKKAGF